MSLVVLAAAAHPDDIEFLMAGTLLALRSRGAQVHTLNIANGCCGSGDAPPEEVAATRLAEASASAALLGATHHPPLANDIEILYEMGLLRRLAALVRRVRPHILLLQSPVDYMEDHSNSARLMVTAAFCRSMPNFATTPPEPPFEGDMAVYHAMPHGLRGPLREPVQPHFLVDVGEFMQKKRAMLACHASQGAWLDATQAMGDHVATMDAMTASMGAIAGLPHAEGWRRHSHLGFAPEHHDPLCDALGNLIPPWRPPT
jgi:LmbE family N-acetylglucosaminyl deacetylase